MLVEDVPQAQAVEIARLADVLVVVRDVLREDEVRGEVVDRPLRLGRPSGAGVERRLRFGDVHLPFLGRDRVQTPVKGQHVHVDEMLLRGDLVVERVEGGTACDIVLHRLRRELLGEVAVEVVDLLRAHAEAHRKDVAAEFVLAGLDGVADRRAHGVRPVDGFLALQPPVVAREKLFDHLPAEEFRVAHDVLLEPEECVLDVRQHDDGVLALAVAVLDAHTHALGGDETDVDGHAAHLRADELPAFESPVGPILLHNAIGRLQEALVLLVVRFDVWDLSGVAHSEVVHVAARAAPLHIPLRHHREVAQGAVDVVHALLERGLGRALVLGADPVADVVDAEGDEAEEELLHGACVNVAFLHLRHARGEHALVFRPMKLVGLLAAKARNVLENVLVEIAPVVDG